MSADQKTEALLKKFLEEDAEAKRRGISLQAVYDIVLRIGMQGNRNERDIASLTRDVERYGKRLGKVEEQVSLISDEPTIADWRPDPNEITGSHKLLEIQARVARQEERVAEEERAEKDDQLWWRRQRVLWAGLVLLAVFAASVTGCIGYVAYRVQSLERSIHEQAPRRYP